MMHDASVMLYLYSVFVYICISSICHMYMPEFQRIYAYTYIRVYCILILSINNRKLEPVNLKKEKGALCAMCD